MQFNAPNGELNITDAVAITGPQVNITCDANVQGDLNLASGTGLYKKVAAISVYGARADLAAGATMVLTVAANEAPNFINVQASARMGVIFPIGAVRSPYGLYRTVTLTQPLNPTPPTINIGQLQALLEHGVSGNNQAEAYSGGTPAAISTLISGVDYDPLYPTVITIGARIDVAASSAYQDDTHRLSLICG
jgi:hypothetical protein